MNSFSCLQYQTSNAECDQTKETLTNLDRHELYVNRMPG